MKYMYLIISYLFISFIFCFSYASHTPSFHIPSSAEVALKEDFSHVVLHDYGKVSFEVVENELMVRYDYYSRIKVFLPEKMSKDDLQLSLDKKNKRESLDHFEGYIYREDEEGIMTTLSLNSPMKVFLDGVEQVFLRSSQMIGSDIIEYSYSVYSDEFFELKDWDFQKDIPVWKSEYHTFIPKEYEYLGIFQGDIEQLKREESNYKGAIYELNENQLNMPIRWRLGKAGGNELQELNLSGTHTQLILENISLLDVEPYMGSLDDYRVRLKQQLIQINLPDSKPYYFIRNWRDINNRLSSHINFGKRLNAMRGMREELMGLVKSITANKRKEKDKAQAIYEYLRNEISWNGEYDIFSGSLRQVWEKKVGNSAEINMWLVNLLRAAKLNASPVLISTREHGRVNATYPIVSQFNHVIVALNVRGGYILLDALSDVVEFGMLPRNDLNGFGFVVDEGRSGILELSPSYAIMRSIYGRFSIDSSTENLDGEMYITHRDYGAALERARMRYDNISTEAYVKSILSNTSELKISSMNIEHLEDWKEPLKLTYDVQVADHVQKIEDLLVVSPFSSGFFEYSPFEKKKRKYPVDFSCPIQESQTFVLEIPSGYEVVQLPENTIMALPDEGGTFIFDIVGVADLIRVSSSLQINQTVFSPGEYPSLQVFFNLLVDKLDEDIILRKIQTQD